MDTLHAGESLGINDRLLSANGRYSLLMQEDGNLVMYEGAATVAAAVWATGTWTLPPEERPVRADMQSDGNFVLYGAADNPVWATGTDGHPGSRLILQDDRNLVIYDASGQPLWASNTWVPLPPPPATTHVGPRSVPLGGDYWQGGYDVADAVAPPVWGLADLHAHPLAHLGFGGNLLWGRVDGPLSEALDWCQAMHGLGGTGIFLGQPAQLLRAALVGFVEGQPNVPPGDMPGFGHLVGGYPQFDGWPRFTSLIHQKMYVDWIRRAYDGGLRLMVALVVNNELLASASGGANYDDRTAVETQIQATKDFVGRHGDFMEIAYSSAEARRIVGENKLAVVLGVEVDSLGNWGREADVESDGNAATYLRHLYNDLGVRHIFPIHLANNAFGGTAVYQELFNYLNAFLRGEYVTVRGAPVDFRLGPALGSPDYSQVGPGQGHANAVGLTRVGGVAIREMMRLGMIVDIDHMSMAAVEDTLALAETGGYPVVAGHAAFSELALAKDEYQRTRDQLDRIRNLGGMVAVGLHQGETNTFGDRVANDAPGSAKSWAQSYLYAIAAMQNAGVGIGTDINGLSGNAGPRFGLNACYDLHRTGDEDEARKAKRRASVYAQRDGVRYDQPIRDYRAYRFEGVLERDVYDMEERDVWEAIAIFKSGTQPDAAEMPGPFRRTVWQDGKIRNIAKGFRATREDQLENPLLGGNTFNEQRAAFLVRQGREPQPDAEEDLKRLHAVIKRIWDRWHAMERPDHPALVRSYAGPQRDYDINIDGVAHYGLLPDFLQDLRNVGLSHENLSTLFRSAEDYIRVWERCERQREQFRAERDAAFVSQLVPSALAPGQSFEVAVTMRNLGQAGWPGADGVRLGSQSPENNTLWGLNRVDIPGPVAPGTEATFRFSLTAPGEPGIYPLQWRMVEEGVEWFGDSTPSVAMVVARPEHPECVGLAETIQQARDEIAAASAEMETADPADKPEIAAAIGSWTTTLNDAERRARELGCPPV